MLDTESQGGDGEDEQAERGFSIRIPTDVGTWLRWSGGALVVMSAVQTLAFLVSISFLAHITFGGGAASAAYLDSPSPGSATLLLGVILLAISARIGELPVRRATRWLLGTTVIMGSTLAAEAVVAAIDRAFHSFSGSSATFPSSPDAAYVGFNVANGVVYLGYVALALAPAVVAVAMWRSTAGVGRDNAGADQHVASFRPMVIAVIAGLAVYIGFFVAFEIAVKAATPLRNSLGG
jgi:hypothetical protein